MVTIIGLAWSWNLLAGSALISAVESIGMTVSDVERSAEFYAKVLHFEKVSDVEVAGPDYETLQGVFGLRMRIVTMRLGDEFIELTEYLAPQGRPYPPDTKSNDQWFQHIAIITSDMNQAYRRLREHRVRHASSGPQRLPDWNPNAGGIQAFYFRDPDGHFLEILQFPAGKGDPKWARSAGRLFLGIDHTAIVVMDTEVSLRYYRDVLGFRVAGESENYGTEQEHLNNVFGARLRITAVRAASGPGIEFLEYLTPRDGRPLPSDARANDILHWQVRLQSGDLSAADKALRQERARFISSEPVTTPRPHASKSLLVRDPDGHALLLSQSGMPE
ncbi:MAG: VOC family protein [Acidobacteriota bacterium]